MHTHTHTHYIDDEYDCPERPSLRYSTYHDMELLQTMWPGNVVGIATGYGLDGPGIESRWGARITAPVQTGPGANPAS
jgi:hypothetical protein